MLHSAAVRCALLAVVLTGCARGNDAATDTTASAGTTGAAAMPPADQGMGNRPAPRDADHDFMRRMIDHHEGMIQMATAAMTKASTPTAQGDAHNVHTKQADEQKKMIADVQAQYGETVTPMVMPSNRAMLDSLATKSGAEYDRTFYRLTVQHHREGIQMVDEMLPRLAKAEVKAMAEKMKADQQKEIADFQRKAGS